jgi:hypothetical protein
VLRVQRQPLVGGRERLGPLLLPGADDGEQAVVIRVVRVQLHRGLHRGQGLRKLLEGGVDLTERVAGVRVVRRESHRLAGLVQGGGVPLPPEQRAREQPVPLRVLRVVRDRLPELRFRQVVARLVQEQQRLEVGAFRVHAGAVRRPIRRPSYQHHERATEPTGGTGVQLPAVHAEVL